MPIIAFADKHGAQNIREQYGHDDELGIAVNENAFQTAEANALVLLFDNRNLAELLLHFYNNAGTNSFDYQILGHALEIDVPPTLTEPMTSGWEELVAPTGVANNATDKQVITEDWAWIAVRLRRTTSGQDSIANVYSRGRKG